MNLFTFFIFLGWTSYIAASDLEDTFRGINIDWKAFKNAQGKKFENSAEEDVRKGHFSRNRDVVKSCNKRKGGEFSCRMNRFSDWSANELKQRNKRLPKKNQSNGKSSIKARDEKFFESSRATNVTLPDAVDWRDHACMTPVKDQGMCGSCWAFAACNPVEIRQCRAKNNTLIDLSPQNLVDCSGKYGNSGCDGGAEYYAWDYVKANGGQASDSKYPYTGVQGKCSYAANYSAAKVKSRKSLLTVYDIKYELAINGPVCAAVAASFDEFYFYGGGVFMNVVCPQDADHSVVIVGYNSTSVNGEQVDYWIIRNSWGSDWGMDGYMLIQSGANLCQIESDVSCPVV